MKKAKLSHMDENGHARMVDVSAKPESIRTAVARGEIHLKPETIALIQSGAMKKGDVFTVAQIAGVMAAKRTADLIPLCHPVPIEHAAIDFQIDETLPGVVITATLKTSAKTGIEMEALTAVSLAALTIYDMVKAVEKAARIQNIRLVEKHGGQSGVVVNE